MLNKLLAAIRRYEMVSPGDTVLCAVSGGADSMALLHLLCSSGCRVTAAHFEHGIRGGESLRDAAFVECFCRERGIPCLVEHGDVPAYAAANGAPVPSIAFPHIPTPEYFDILKPARRFGWPGPTLPRC